jgi:hypothetical protein
MFVSHRYGFGVTLPADWSGHDARVNWNGKRLQGLNSAAFANFTDPTTGRTLVVGASPVAKGTGLPNWRAAMVRAAPDVCSDAPAAQHTTLGGEPGLDWTSTCSDGYNVIKLAALHGQRGYMILLASTSGDATAANRRIFESLRRSFRFTMSGLTTATSSTTPTAVAGAGTTGLRRFLLGSGDEPGYSDQGTADASSSLRYWLKTYPTDNGEASHGAGTLAGPTAAANRPQQFSADGWVAGATVQITGVNGGSGVSTVHELRSAAGARRDWDWRVKYIPLAALTDVTYPLYGSKTMRFTVPGVPSAVGYAATSSHHGDDGAIVAWIEGRCVLYLKNEGNVEPLASFAARIRAGVAAIYRRTGGTCPQ